MKPALCHQHVIAIGSWLDAVLFAATTDARAPSEASSAGRLVDEEPASQLLPILPASRGVKLDYLRERVSPPMVSRRRWASTSSLAAAYLTAN